MAATLAHIKSKMLLPEEPTEGDGEEEADHVDPRAELVRRLLEYQKYKRVAEQLGSRPALGRDVFTRGGREPEREGPAPFAPGDVFKLFDAFDQVLKRAKQSAEHEVLLERISIAERMVELTELLHDCGRVRFEELFEIEGEEPSKYALVLTFLAILEMCRRNMIRVLQDESLGPLFVEFDMAQRSPSQQRAKPLGLRQPDWARGQPPPFLGSGPGSPTRPTAHFLAEPSDFRRRRKPPSAARSAKQRRSPSARTSIAEGRRGSKMQRRQRRATKLPSKATARKRTYQRRSRRSQRFRRR